MSGYRLEAKLDSSGAIRPGGIASELGVVNMNIRDGPKGELGLERSLKLLSLAQIRSHNHSVIVEGSQREHPNSEEFGHLIDGRSGLLDALADKNRVAGTIGRGGILMRVVDENQSVTDIGVGEADAAGETRFSGRSAKNREMVGKFIVLQSEKRCELLMSESADLKAHRSLLSDLY